MANSWLEVTSLIPARAQFVYVPTIFEPFSTGKAVLITKYWGFFCSVHKD